MKFELTVMRDSANSYTQDVQCIMSTMTEANRVSLKLTHPDRIVELCLDELEVVVNAANKGE